MTPCVKPFLAGALASVVVLAPAARTAVAAEPQSRITILYDAFGKDASMKKDWGFSALVEVAGKRILFDTGNDRDTFAATSRRRELT
jgi:Metal-dependent hydrolases of the beta-lactamase superfamily II